MSLHRLAWREPYEGEDIHVLRGAWSTPLRDRIKLIDNAGDDVLPQDAAPSDLRALAFTTNLDASFTAGGAAMAPGLEVEFDHILGRVLAPQFDSYSLGSMPSGEMDTWSAAEVDAARATMRVTSFIVTVNAEVTGSTGAAVELPKIRLRVHLHRTLEEVWLTPDRLTLPHDFADNRIVRRRPTLLGRFHDGTIGDLTNEPGTSWAFGGAPDLPDPQWPFVDPERGLMHASPSVPVGDYEVHATMAPAWGAAAASTTIEVVPGWDARPEADRELVDLHGASDVGPLDLLIIGDGVTTATEADFRVAALRLTHQLRTVSRPVGDLFGSMNAWMYAPVGPHGINVNTQMQLTAAFDTAVPEPKPTTHASTWFYEHVVSELDLSDTIMTEMLDVQEGAGQFDVELWARNRWRLLFGLTKAEVDDIAGGAIRDWRRGGPRYYANEVDTPLGLTRGARAGFGSLPNRVLGLNPRRMDGDELHGLLETLVTPAGDAVGDHWTTGDAATLVVIIGVGHGSGGAFHSAYGASCIALPKDGRTLRASQDGSPGERLYAQDWSDFKRYERQALGVLTHELGHAFGLGDEYGGSTITSRGDLARAFTYSNLDIGPDDNPGNTIDRGIEDAAGALNGDRMRWAQIHRISYAWTVDQGTSRMVNVTPSSDWVTNHSIPFEVDGRRAMAFRLGPGALERGEAAGFTLSSDGADASRVWVRARQRRRKGPIKPAFGPWIVELIHAPAYDDQWLVLRPEDDSTRDMFQANLPTTEGTSPIIFLPVPQPGAPGEHAMLVSKMMRDHVTQTGRPLDAPATGVWDCVPTRPDYDMPRMTNPPAALKFGKPFWPSRRMVGLWTGGSVHDCDVYHPTAHSIMRSSLVRTPPLNTDGVNPEDAQVDRLKTHIPYDSATMDLSTFVGQVNEFDPVSTFLLIDAIDPGRHHEWEAIMAKRDPDRWA